MKIAFIGGGSMQWTALLTIDLALTDTLAGATLALHDIDAGALVLMTRVAERITTQLGRDLQIAATAERAEALRGADFVILCVAIGGLAAMRNDLAIPWRDGVAQSVGDTVGPGGLARGLRHIPFAVQVAREMEQLCPHAWLLNLTNPMTTICRAITRATNIRMIGLCHEVGGVRHNLAKLFDVALSAIEMSVGGINHLPALLHFTVDGVDGAPLLRAWLAEHGPFAWASQRADDPLKDIFADRLAIKLTIFDQTGVLFGAGDRHVAEFFNLPRDAVVECMAEIGPLGLRPLSVGALPHAAYAAIAPHVARQELIVEAALTGRRAPALAALASDPLLRDPATVAPMLDALLAANAEVGAPLLT